MNRKERFHSALKLQIPDRVPMFDFLFQKPMYDVLIGHRPEVYNGPDAVRLALALDHDGVWLAFGSYGGFQPKSLHKNVYVDEWGTTYQKNEYAWPIDAPVDYPIKSRADLAEYKVPDPTLPGRTSEIDAVRNMETDHLALVGGIQGPLTTAWLLMGYERICYALYDDPAMLKEIFRFAVDYFMEAARLCVEVGCDSIVIGEDFGDSHSGFMKLEHFRKYVLPPFAELVEYTSNLGVPVLLHSCGHITEYLDDLAQTKIDAIHPLQRTAGMDLRMVKNKYGKRFCIIGNIDSSQTLPFGTTADVAADPSRVSPGGAKITPIRFRSKTG